MAVNQNDIVSRIYPDYKQYWLTGVLEHNCGQNPISLPVNSTVQEAAARFDFQIAVLQDQQELSQFVRIPKPLDIARAADERLQQMLAEMTDIHETLKALNIFGATDDATEAAVNSSANTKALTLKNALIAYRQHWIDNSFSTEQADAQADPAAWKTALKNFVASNLGSMEWCR